MELQSRVVGNDGIIRQLGRHEVGIDRGLCGRHTAGHRGIEAASYAHDPAGRNVFSQQVVTGMSAPPTAARMGLCKLGVSEDGVSFEEFDGPHDLLTSAYIATQGGFFCAVLRQNPVSCEKPAIADRPGRSVSFEAGLHSLQSALSRRPQVQFSPAAPGCPFRSWVFGDVEMQHAPPVVGEDDEDEEDLEGCRGNGEEIDRDQVTHVVLEKGPVVFSYRLLRFSGEGTFCRPLRTPFSSLEVTDNAAEPEARRPRVP